ncbi:M23 family metallopeptidase [Actinomadura rudentiformis]|uniref:M23 family metallopeptidase n=1 Tax=Actinomadura rudentiformis TaxID=359158 RepID=A0A6H9YS70_9ACTN|nr:M23 family metallopeptidase [Actinomadura rudentiformis]KAB2350846.1 M23 family metallopeptidase [Actinomadura rudentiformis]
MSGKWRTRRARMSIPVVAAAALAGGQLTAGAAAQTVDQDTARTAARPKFQLPLPCGQKWWTSTHKGHASKYMVDMINKNGKTQGTPVLASAAGKVTESKFYRDAGNVITVNHGGGWSTRHMHLDIRSVKVGAKVNLGTKLGTVGNTGSWTSGAHLHYQQQLNGKVVQAKFNGRTLPVKWKYGQHYETSKNKCGPEPPKKYYVVTKAKTSGYTSTNGKIKVGFLNKGKNYVFCTAKGASKKYRNTTSSWWLKTDLDSGHVNKWVPAAYLGKGGGQPKDTKGKTIPRCK